MTKGEILKIVEQQLPHMRAKYGLLSIALFGSFAKEDARTDSDIDFLVELETPLVKNYFGLLTFLEKQFAKPIGLIRKGAHTNSTFLSSIKDDLIYAG